MKKTTLLILLAIVTMVTVSCRKKTSYSSSEGADSSTQTELIDDDYDTPYKTRNTVRETGAVDQFIKLVGKMGDEIMDNPMNIDRIGQKFERLASNIDDNTPVSRSEVRRMNNAVMKMMEKVIKGMMIQEGIDPESLTAEQRNSIITQLDDVSRQLNRRTSTVTSLGEYGETLGEFMDSL